jgi:hypothetical protein
MSTGYYSQFLSCLFLVVQMSTSLETAKNNRHKLESERETIIERMQLLHRQIAARRKEGSNSFVDKRLYVCIDCR